MAQRLGNNQRKILILLLGGLTIGLSGSPKTAFQIIRAVRKEWKEIDKRALRRAIKSLYQSKLISERQNPDGTTTLVLTGKGKQKALTYDLENMEIKKPAEWDGKWRVVLFDIPERIKKARDSIRFHLKNLGFFEYQKSVFAHPYDCRDEIDYLIEFYDIRRFVRIIIADSLDNELHLKKHFGLL